MIAAYRQTVAYALGFRLTMRGISTEAALIYAEAMTMQPINRRSELRGRERVAPMLGPCFEPLEIRAFLSTTIPTQASATADSDALALSLASIPLLVEDAGPQTIENFARVGVGHAEGSSSSMHFLVSGLTRPWLFASLPTVDDEGTLRFELDADASGSFSFTLSVMTDDGDASSDQAVGTPQTVQFTVLPLNDPPKVGALIAGNAVFERGAPLRLTATGVLDVDSPVAAVQFFRKAIGAGLVDDSDGIYLGQDTNSSDGWSIMVPTSLFPIGEVTILARAADSNGALSRSVTTDVRTMRITRPNDEGSTTYADADGNIVTVLLTGPGSFEIVRTSEGNADAQSINVLGTTERSTLTILTEPGVITTVGKINVGLVNDPSNRTPIKSIIARTTQLDGDLTITGHAQAITMGDLTGNHVIRIGEDPDEDSKAALTFQAGQVSDISLTSMIPIKLLSVASWLDTDENHDTITAPNIKALRVAGDLAANVVTTDELALIKTIDIEGALRGAIHAWGNIGKVDLGGIIGGSIYAGFNSDITGLPISLDLAAPDGEIASVTVRGLPGQAFSVVNAVIASANIKKITLRDVKLDNNGVEFGILADRIKSYVRHTTDGPTVKLKGLDAPIDNAEAEESGDTVDLVVRIADITDFEVIPEPD